MEASTTIRDGRADIAAAAADLAERLPPELGALARLAYNYRWSWTPGGHELFGSIDPERFEAAARNPVRLLQETPRANLKRAAADPEFLESLVALDAEVSHALSAEGSNALAAEAPHALAAAPTSSNPAAFLCAEYGIHVSLPIYSGGLGALAGDLVKEASDQGAPLVGVGLMYRKGYFRQRIDASGWQHEYWVDTDPERTPATLVRDASGTPLTIAVPIFDAIVTAQIWRVDVGRVPLFLLDTDCPQNGPLARWITARLYVADADIRIAQYVLLGVGGIRALRAMGIEPSLVHLNEGHAALAPLELAAPAVRAGQSLADALAGARERTVFTTHTPVPAGNDSYPAAQVEAAILRLAEELGVSAHEVIVLGRTHPDDGGEPFGVTQAALHTSRSANGVSRRHGEVARDMWQELWPHGGVEDVPIGHVTNGVHVPTWLGAPMRALLDRHLPEGWLHSAADPEMWAGVDGIPDEELWAARQAQRAALTEFVRVRSPMDRLSRGDNPEYVQAAARWFDPEVLTLGFARRVATYKRLDLLTRDPDWTLALLGGDRPVQVVLAGKAHPRDEEAKRALQRLFGLRWAEIIGRRVVFLDDYDLASGAALVRGCDVWLNLPRPPLEASGTSGMKSVVNGGVQLSVLDGWWAEGYDGSNGWAIDGGVDHDHGAQDARDADALHRVLDHEVVPAFYDRDERGISVRWLAVMRASLRTLAPQFSATRMLGEYLAGPYRG